MKAQDFNKLLEELGFVNLTGNLWKHKTEHGIFTFESVDDIVPNLIRFGEGMKAAEIRGCLNIEK